MAGWSARAQRGSCRESKRATARRAMQCGRRHSFTCVGHHGRGQAREAWPRKCKTAPPKRGRLRDQCSAGCDGASVVALGHVVVGDHFGGGPLQRLALLALALGLLDGVDVVRCRCGARRSRAAPARSACRWASLLSSCGSTPLASWRARLAAIMTSSKRLSTTSRQSSTVMRAMGLPAAGGPSIQA